MAESKMTIKKVKVVNDGKKKCIQVDYRLSRDQIDDELTGLFREEAAPEFYAAFEELRGHVVEILEVGMVELGEGGKTMFDRIHPYGVTFHYSKDGTMSAIISSKFDLPDAGTCIVLNTPMRKSYAEDSGESVLLTEAATKALWAVEMETRKYIGGKRAQMSLFGENGETAPDTSQEVGDDDGSEDYSGDDEEGQERPLKDFEGEEGTAAMNGPLPPAGARRGAVIVDINRGAAVAAV